MARYLNNSNSSKGREAYTNYKESVQDYEQNYVEAETHNVQYEKHVAYRPICKLSFSKQRGAC